MTRGTTRIAQLTAAPLNQRMPTQHRCRTDNGAVLRPDLPTQMGLRPAAQEGYPHGVMTIRLTPSRTRYG